MNQVKTIALAVVVVLVLVVVVSAAFIVDETQQVIITQFGKPVGEPITDPGLHWKLPVIQKVHYFDKRFLEWDGDPEQLPTRDKRFIWVDTYARWRISDPLQFFKRLRDERSAQTRLDDILDGETRNTIARHDLIEVVRITNREFEIPPEMVADQVEEIDVDIKVGRAVMQAEVLRTSRDRASDLGIEILDFRFKRINYVKEVRVQVYERMKSERNRIAERFRSEGDGEAARILGEKERDLKQITSEAYKEAQKIQGEADATAADIYARAYNRDPEFYRFIKTMETYRETMTPDTVLLLDTEGEFLRYLERSK